MDTVSSLEQSSSYPRNSRDEKTAPATGELDLRTTSSHAKPQHGHVSTIWTWLKPDIWGLEILSFCITLVCFACLFIVLGIFDQKALPNWPSGLTLNTVVSWIATILKATLLLPVGSCISQLCWLWYSKQRRSLTDLEFFDGASRGPLGSLRLIFRLRGSYLACLGAFITIVALGLDPFFQQTIKYPSRTVASHDSVAQVVFATSYDGQFGETGGGELIEASSALPSNLKGAIYSGLWSSETLPPPSPLFSCSSGNCTWPLFSTLAANLKCENITSRVTLNCSEFSSPPSPPTTCNFISLRDPMLNQTLNGSTSQTFMAMNTIDGDTVQLYWDYMGNYTGVIVGFQWVKALSHFTTVYSDGGPLAMGPHTTWEAEQCLLYFGVNQLRAHVSAGVYSEETVDSYFWDGTGPLDPTSAEPLNLAPPFAPHQPFNISGLAFESIVSDYLEVLGLSEQVITGSISGYSTSGSGSSDLILRLWYAQNVTRILNNLNVYVTNSLRANQSSLLSHPANALPENSIIDPYTSINGTVWIPVPYVQVKWAWLAMPLALYVLVGILLFLTMIQTARQEGVGVWKSSPVALLLHGLPDVQIQRVNTMEDAAEAVRVRLAPDRAGVLRMLPE